MGKGWDNSWIAFQKETRERCLKALKPWGYLLAFGGSRTYHRIACAIEDAGFEIRDCIMWLYGSWFPKSLNIWLAIDKKNGVESKVIGKSKSGSTSKAFNLNEQQREAGTGILAGEYDLREAQNEWNGWGTALKPSYEPIIVARKPLEWSCTDNVIKYWVGGINIDECRVEAEDLGELQKNWDRRQRTSSNVVNYVAQKDIELNWYAPQGRFPANTILTYWEEDKEEVCSGFHDNEQRYYYTAKASKRDRDEGLDGFDIKWAKELLNREENSDGASWNGKYSSWNAFAWCWAPKKNTHPTVKPTDLMQYLVRLVTPNGWTVLDPFNWSGSTGKAVMYENKDRNKNYKYIGIELTEEYLPIAKARIEYVINKWEKKGEWLKQQPLF